MVAMGCRSLDFAAVEADLGFAVGFGDLPLAWLCHWASPISLSPDCFTRLCGGLELGRAPAPRTDVTHMIVMICGGLQWVLRWIAVGCGGFDWVGCGGSDWVGFAMGLWVFLRWFAVDLRWIAVMGLHLQWFLFFFFFSFYVAPNIVKYFRDHFLKCKQTLKKQSFSLKLFSFTNILR